MSTIHDVAKCAGVSSGTVSNYLNGKRVNKNNAQKIASAISELDYEISYHAHCISSKQTLTIGLMVNDPSSSFSTIVVSQIVDFLFEKGYMSVVCNFNSDRDLYQKSLEMLIHRKVDGIVIVEGFADHECNSIIDKNNIPVVSINSEYDCKNVDNISTDNRRTACRVVEMMFEEGHEKIAVITGPCNTFTSKERLLGVKQAYDKHDVNRDNLLIIKCEDTSNFAGCMAMQKIMSRGYDCVFALNFGMGLGAIAAASQKGLIAGTNYRFAFYSYKRSHVLTNPGVSIVYFGAEEVGRSAARYLFGSIEEGRKSKGIKIEIPNNIEHF